MRTAAIWFLAGATPVEKVITLLTDLHQKVEDEGKAEAASYDKFACYCRDTTAEKSGAISTGSDSIDLMTANIGAAAIERKVAEETILETKQALEDARSDKGRAETEWATYLKEHTENLGDTTMALSACDSALQTLQQSMSETALAQVKAMVTPLLIQARERPYEFHSDNILGLVQKLKKQFADKKTELETDHTRRKTAHDDNIKGLEGQITAGEKRLGTNELLRDTKAAFIAETTGDLTREQNVLHDNQLFLKEVTQQCESKAKTWDQRSQTRADEMKAISSALTIITSKAQPKDYVNERAFLEKPDDELTGKSERKGIVMIAASQRAIQRSLAGEHKVLSAHNRRKAVGRAPSRVIKTRGATLALITEQQGTREEVIEQISRVGSSPELLELVSKLRADPLAEVKQLVRQLIDRLLNESNEEATQHGWCETELAKARTTRAFADEKASAAAAQVTKFETKQSSLNQTMVLLDQTELPDLRKSLSELEVARAAEKKSNGVTLEDAIAGSRAVKEAIVLLKDFYRNAAYIQASPVDGSAPDAGFSGAYKGAQDSKGGVIGMLEVLQGDFDRTTKMVSESEETAHREFVEMKRATSVDISSKQTQLKQTQEDIELCKVDLKNSLTEMKQQQTILDLALQELDKLKPACIQTTMTFAERKQRRETEIAALENAIKMLSA